MKSTFKKQMFVQAKNPDMASSNCSSSASSSNPQSFIDPATYMQNGEFVFRIPPEAPVFEPTVEEFLDPLAYINKIRPIAERTGICKVKPPPEWHPPFAVDVDHFKFTPRIQKLNELDANTRVRLYFLDRLATYWNYSGVQIRIPAIEDKTVDMYSLYKLVEMEGGFERISAEKRWTRIATRMGYVNEKTVAPILRQHYKRWLLPYERFEKTKVAVVKDGNVDVDVDVNVNVNVNVDDVDPKQTTTSTPKKKESESAEKSTNATYVKQEAASSPDRHPKAANSSLGRRCTRSNCDDAATEILVSDTFKNPTIADKNKELQRLTFYGPGPKILGSNKQKAASQSPAKKSAATGTGTGAAAAADSAAAPAVDSLADSACMLCGNGDSEECILLCDGCDDGYHTFCLVPPLNSVPKGEWRCPKCVALVVSKANDTTFGFEQAEREYSLQQFGEMADQFKSNYFNMPVHMVPTERVEHEYWKILSSMDSNVSVEYGADLHSMDHGSGFPTLMALKQSGDENHYHKSYVESSWNLNNIPVLEGSVLGYINADISGMKIPWMYVGMCFSTFCWHNEDHWSYSINYLHWGEPKTWYGVPGYMAEKFESVMQETTPDLFRNQPDLLHQLVTILNPNILMDRGVPVFHIDQAAGEFVVTFPRAYHAGFNHGYNFAEAVNFAPVDWIPLGRECVEHYSSLHRYCVFSHDELICKMASVPESLNSKLASATHQDMVKMQVMENKQRKALLEWGVINAEREAFELLADDERKCSECNTTCFLSAVTCKCNPKKVTCLRHFRNHCTCAAIEHTLRYRYTLDELPVMLEKLKEKADSVAVWAAKVHDALNISTPRTITLSGLKELLHEAEEKSIPDEQSRDSLSNAIKSVQNALQVDFKNILSHKQMLCKKVTLTEIRNYYEELQCIPCVLPQENMVKHFLKFLEEFEDDVNKVTNNYSTTLDQVDALVKKAQFPNVDIPCVNRLEQFRQVVQIIEDYKSSKSSSKLPLDVINELLNRCRSTEHPSNELSAIIKELTVLRDRVILWEKKVKVCLHDAARDADSKPDLSRVEKLVEESKSMDAIPPSREHLFKILQKVSVWRARASNLLTADKIFPFYEQIEWAIDEAENIEVDLQEVAELKTIANRVNAWKEEVHRLFLGECQAFGLLEVLMPRRNLQRVCKYKSDDAPSTSLSECADLLSAIDLGTKESIDVQPITSFFHVAEKREFELLRALRVKNTYKRKQHEATFCICNNSSTLLMKECVLCKDLFHEQCVKELANHWNDSKPSVVFLCPFCQRTKRPEVKAVNSSLQKLQKMHARTLEGVAMQCLLDREVKWKELVNDLLSTPEMVSILQAKGDQKQRSTRNHRFLLSSEHKGMMETLLLHGFLLELDVPENELIYKILHTLDEEPSNKSAAFDPSAVDIELTNETCCLENELSSAREKKRKLVENNEDDKVHAVTKRQLNGKKKMSTPTTLCKRKRVMPPVADKLEDFAKSNGNKMAENIETRQNSTPEIEEEEETECEAKQCLRPTGEHVDWVQCDYCKNWLHMICIGVTKGEVDAQTEFMCSLCRNVDCPRSKNDDSAGVDDDDDSDVVFVQYTPQNATICSS